MSDAKFSAIPAKACILSIGDFEVGDNGENAKTAPVSLVARSGKPIEHWFWGKVVHDLSGMKLNKQRLVIDYCHDDKEIIGYLNKFDSSSGDLITSGALVPFKDSDRATEIIHKMKMGVPYQASINFGGDGIVIEEVAEGQSVEVNGYTLTGEAVIVRQWPLRGVAVCPYGADENTESTMFNDNNKTFNATVASAIVPTETKQAKEESEMKESVEAVEGGTKKVQAAVEDEMIVEKKTEEAEAPEVEAVEAPAVEEVPAVEAVVVEEVIEEVEAVPSSSDEVEKAKKEIEDMKKQKQEADAEIAIKEEMAKLAQEKMAIEAELTEAKRKLSAYDKGETVLTATAEPTNKLTAGNPWADARKSAKK